MDEFTEAELEELHADFEAAQRRPLKTRLHSAFARRGSGECPKSITSRSRAWVHVRFVLD